MCEETGPAEDGHRIPMTHRNNKISKRDFDEGPAVMVCQRSEALNQTNDTVMNICV